MARTRQKEESAGRPAEDRAARKAAAGLKQPVEVPPELLTRTVEELNALSDDLDRQRSAIMELKRQVAAARAQILAEENAAIHGMTVEQYDAAKAAARAAGEPLLKVLSKARVQAARERRLQVAQAGAAAVSGRAHKS